MKCSELATRFTNLVNEGHGDKQVFAVHSASGAADPVNGPYITDYVGDAGPFDLQPSEKYISLSIGY